MPLKRKSSKEVIEETSHPETEHQFIKYPEKEPVDITDYKKSRSGYTRSDAEKAKKVIQENNLRPYTHIHTHPYQTYRFWPTGISGAIERLFHRTGKTEAKGIKEITGLPSSGDLNAFLYTNNMKTMVIAVRNTENGKVVGYHILRKTKDTPAYVPTDKDFERAPIRSVLKGVGIIIQIMLGLVKPIESYNYDVRRIRGLKEGKLEKSRQAFEDLAHKYNLRYRMVVSSGYKVNETRTSFSENRSSLEEKVAAFVGLISFSLCLIFSSFNLTGNAVGFQRPASNTLGILFFLIGLIGTIFYLQSKK